jgi:hypothetical protein
MYVDSNFAGMWHKEHSHLRNNVLSRTGYVIFFVGCPVTWVSKLQTEITLSTAESEYIALSTATQDLLPLWELLQDIGTHSFISLPKQSKPDLISTPSLTPSIIYEDNSACIMLATTDSTSNPEQSI